MNVKAMKTANTDRLILVSGRDLLKQESDIECRKSQVVEDVYHKDWFYDYDGFNYFIPPAAYIQEGKIFYINGRHRVVLLARHMNEFPFLIGNLDMDHIHGKATNCSINTYNQIKVSDFGEHTIFSLPDLDFGSFQPADA